MGELIPFPDRCEGCDADATQAGPRGQVAAALCRRCASRLRRGLFGLLPQSHQRYVLGHVWDACLREARGWLGAKDPGAIEERAKATRSEMTERHFKARAEDLTSLVGLFPSHADPAQDARVLWLLDKIASAYLIRQRAIDVYYDNGGRRQVSVDDATLERGGDDPTYREPAQTPEDALAARDAKAAALGLLLLLVDTHGPRDDAVIVFQLLRSDLSICDEVGVRAGTGQGAKLPIKQVAQALEATAHERPWDNMPWTQRRVDNAREKFIRVRARLPEDAEERRFYLANLWAEYSRLQTNRT